MATMTIYALTTANAHFCMEGMELVISGTSGRDLPRWVTRRPFQDGDRLLVRWLCRIFLGWEFNINGPHRIRRILNRTTLELS